MQLGYFTMPVHPLSRRYPDTLKEDRESFILADRLGYVEGYVGEHITDLAESITDSCTFLASLIDATKSIKLGTGTVNLPNGHPAAIAAKVAMLDNLLEGRFIFGISPGGLPSDWEMFDNLSVDRRAKFQESIDQILSIWTGEAPYNLKGNFFSVSTEKTMLAALGQGLIVRPWQRPHPPIVVTAAEPSSKSVMNAGIRGWNVISANFLLPQWVRSHWTTYVEGCAHVGRQADTADWRVAKTIFVADDEQTALSYGLGVESPYRFYYEQLGDKLVKAGRANLFKADPTMSDEEVTTNYILDRLMIAGTVDQVIGQLLAFRNEVGDFGTLLYCGTDWVDPGLSRRSMELMAKEVMPGLNRAIAESAR